MSHRVRASVIAFLSMALVLLRAEPAWAPFHVLVIEEVFFGTEECPNAQYVKLRTKAPGQTFVANQVVSVQNADGSPAPAFGTFSRNLSNGASGVAILMATPEAESLFGIEADQEINGRLPFPSGRVCFGDFGGPVDCVAYGNFLGRNEGFGTPAAMPERGLALVRVSETDDNANDFDLDEPEPENNAGDIGELGAGSCEVAPTPTPRSTPPQGSNCAGDCNGNGEVTVDELIRGVNMALGQASVDPCFDTDADGQVAVSELVRAVINALNGCGVEPTPTPTRVPGALGIRRFSLNPEESGFRLAGLPIPIQGVGFTGHIDFSAGVPDPDTGIAIVDIVGASEFLSIVLRIPIGPAIVICLRPDSDLLPIRGAGVISCNGGNDFSVELRQDHNTNDEDPNCERGTRDQNAAHAGVCNGPFEVSQLGEDSGPGALLIAPNPQSLQGGFPVRLTIENALPCGDEGGGGELRIPLALTTGTFRAVIEDRNNVPGQTLETEERGENFSCANWEQEDGPGTLVFAAPVIDFNTGVIGFQDIVNVFFFDD